MNETDRMERRIMKRVEKLEEVISAKFPDVNLIQKAGQSWTIEEEDRLMAELTEFARNVGKTHFRSTGSILSRIAQFNRDGRIF